MNTNNTLFLSNIPERGHQLPGGKNFTYNDKNLSFECGCGETHAVSSAYALREHREFRTTIYACPNNDYLLNLVKEAGLFSVKKLDPVASYLSDQSDDFYTTLYAFRKMKEAGIESLHDYFNQ